VKIEAPRIRVQNESELRLKCKPIVEALTQLLVEHGRIDKEVNVLITDDKQMKALNSSFRAVREATDVLTFPAPDVPHMPLGDIAISLDFAIRGGKARGVSASQEAAMLAIHGCLHLLGYDDETEQGRAEMIRLMNEAAAKAGIKTDPGWSSQPHLVLKEGAELGS